MITHDDNFLVGNDVLEVALEGKVDFLYHNDYLEKSFHKKDWKNDWLVITNAFIPGKPHLRGSFDFFTKEMMNKIGGIFDLSKVNLTREGLFDTPPDHSAIAEWNKHIIDFLLFLLENKLFDRVYCLSNTYRVSDYCIEGERGFLSRKSVLGAGYQQAVLNLIDRRPLV